MNFTPLNLPKWLEENSHLLKPPINNYCVYNEGFTVMVVGGPNARTDYHINSTPEWFYQHRGTMLLKVVDPSHIPSPSTSYTSTPSTISPSPSFPPATTPPPEAFRDIFIPEGSMFLLPPNIPHNPVRFANTVGIVLEMKRPEGSTDVLRWYCGNGECRNVVYEEGFHCTDLGSQIKGAVEGFQGDPGKRVCKGCGRVAESKPAPGEIKDPNVE